MLRSYSRVIASAVMLVGLPTAQAADTTLTLACKGTAVKVQLPTKPMDERKPISKPEAISMGIIVNFAARTVYVADFGFLHKITSTNDDATLEFQGKRLEKSRAILSTGSVDRVTGDATLLFSIIDVNTPPPGDTAEYTLKCRPA